MKRIYFIISMLLIVCFSFAQNTPSILAKTRKAPATIQTIDKPIVQTEVVYSDPINEYFFDGAEEHPDFVINSTLNDWSYIDVDGSVTWSIDGYDFPGANDPMCFIIFNASTTTPPLVDEEEQFAFEGKKIFACFDAILPADGGTGPNNDWMISPELENPTIFSFWAASFNDNYGLERIRVGYSTTGKEVEDFTIMTPYPYISVPIDWNYYFFELPEGTKYVALNCVSNDAFFLCVDDYIIEFEPNGINTVDLPAFSVVPNPTSSSITITSKTNFNKIEVVNYLGQSVILQQLDNSSCPVDVSHLPNGTYLVRVTNEFGSTVQKFIKN